MISAVRQWASVCPAPPEQTVSRPHLLCGVRRRASGHPWPDMGGAETVSRHALSPQQCQVGPHTRALSEWLLSHTEWVLIVFLRFFTYGDLPLEQHLRQIEEEALSKFECIDPNTEVPAQPRWSTPVSWYISPDVSNMTTVSTQSRFSSCD